MDYKITEYFSNTKETIERAADTGEIAEIKARQNAILEIEAEAEAKTIARQEILDRLGLTADEAKLLLG